MHILFDCILFTRIACLWKFISDITVYLGEERC
uniref:Uncharacterized protein n=1 Tax=Arundo donax TaxID=35708 RepID=A0A0A8ZKN4_ARUDO